MWNRTRLKSKFLTPAKNIDQKDYFHFSTTFFEYCCKFETNYVVLCMYWLENVLPICGCTLKLNYNVVLNSGSVNPGKQGSCDPPPQILVDYFTLFQPGWAYYDLCSHIHNCPFSGFQTFRWLCNKMRGSFSL